MTGGTGRGKVLLFAVEGGNATGGANRDVEVDGVLKRKICEAEEKKK